MKHSADSLRHLWGLGEDAAEVLFQVERFMISWDRSHLASLVERLFQMVETCEEGETSSYQGTLPSYYGRDRGLEVIDIIEEWGLGFHLGNVLKYTVRAGKKGSASLDLKKALWYAKRFSDTLDPPSRCI